MSYPHTVTSCPVGMLFPLAPSRFRVNLDLPSWLVAIRCDKMQEDTIR